MHAISFSVTPEEQVHHIPEEWDQVCQAALYGCARFSQGLFVFVLVHSGGLDQVHRGLTFFLF
jgi:hypothetical protein